MDTMPALLEIISARLEAVSVDESELAKHRQLTETVLSLIEDETLKPGDRFPTEAALARALPFSVGTIQKSMSILSELGVVNRRKGRGTLIADKTGEIFAPWQFRFVSEDQDSILPLFSTVTSIEIVKRNGAWSEFLGKEQSFVRIEREIDVDNRFKFMSSFYLSGKKFSPIADSDKTELEGSHLHAVVQRKFGVGTDRTYNRVVCSTIPDPICLRLNLPSGARGLVCQILGFTNGDQPLWFQEVHVPADAEPMEFREIRPSA
jgi:GntR family transcriptional regulator|tara:strand:- start:166 stop:954 length:789 start_codon:yes stop_codon:yes gene_type:complete